MPKMSILPSRNQLAAVALGGWFAAVSLLGAGLLARHVVALPAPASDEGLARSLRQFRGADGPQTWLAVHVLYAECRCSQRIATHLLATQRPAGWHEVVLWVGNATPSPQLERHFDVRRIEREELSRLGIEAAPLLVALDSNDRVRYSGGYSNRKQGSVVADLTILESARREAHVAALPLFGCAVGDRLKRYFGALPSGEKT